MRRPAQVNGDCAGIVEIEHRLNHLLRHQIQDQHFVRSLRSTLREWSQTVWAAAECRGMSTPRSPDLEHGLRLAQRPVFVCGAARSGTSLLRDLLDGHPELIVIPNESGFYPGMERALSGLRSERHCAYLGCRWLERLVDAPPFWPLGSSTIAGSPYIAFAREFAGWSQAPRQHPNARITSWPLAAFALAYAQRLSAGRIPRGVRMWVEKTPGNERFLSRIWQDFPQAKVIQIVRRPEAVLASMKRMPGTRWSHRRTLAHVVGKMAPSYRIAAKGDHLPDGRYCLVRYEDLTADPGSVMPRIAEFLGIAPHRSLLQPTTAGRPGFNNTSFGSWRSDPYLELSPIERALLNLATARNGAKLGYARAERSQGAGHAIVGTFAMTGTPSSTPKPGRKAKAA